MEPYNLYRLIISLVLGAMWFYTIYGAIVYVYTMLWKPRGSKIRELEWELEEEGVPEHRREQYLLRRRLFRERGIRIMRKYAKIKILQLLSWRTVWQQRRELSMILILIVADVFALHAFYTMKLVA